MSLHTGGFYAMKVLTQMQMFLGGSHLENSHTGFAEYCQLDVTAEENMKPTLVRVSNNIYKVRHTDGTSHGSL